MSDSVRPHRRPPTRLPHPWDSPGKNTGVGCHFLLQCMKVKVKSLSRVRLLATPWTAAYQAPPSMGFSRQEYWSGVPLPSPRGSWPVTNPVLKSLLVQFRRHRDTYQNGPKALPKGHHGGRACPEKVREDFLEEGTLSCLLIVHVV